MDLSTRLSEYVTICRKLGLDDAAIVEHHAAGVEDPSTADPREAVAHALGEDCTPGSLRRRLITTLARSDRGIDVERDYSHVSFVVQLRTALAAVGGELDVEDATGEVLERAEDPRPPYRVAIADPKGTMRTEHIPFPDHPLGTDNVPGFVAGLERELLWDTPLKFVRLLGSGRWRLLLTSWAELQPLQREFGERLEFAGGPLLAERQPPEFLVEAGEPVPDPPDYSHDTPDGADGEDQADDSLALLDKYGGGEPDTTPKPDPLVTTEADTGGGETSARAGGSGSRSGPGTTMAAPERRSTTTQEPRTTEETGEEDPRDGSWTVDDDARGSGAMTEAELAGRATTIEPETERRTDVVPGDDVPPAPRPEAVEEDDDDGGGLLRRLWPF